MVYFSYSLFTLPDLDSDSDSKPNGYIALCSDSFVTARTQIPILTDLIIGMGSETESVKNVRLPQYK